MRPYLFAHGKLDLIGFTFPSCLHIPTFPGNFRLETALLFPSAPTEEMSDLRSPTETDETPRRLMSWTLGQYVEFREADGKIFTKNEREYPKTEGAIPSGRSPRGIAPEVFGYSLEF